MNSNPGNANQRFLALALIMAFLPSLLIIGMFSLFFERNMPAAVLVGECFFCALCSFTSAFILVRSEIVWAIVLGILFSLLNALISFFFGCTAFLSGLNH